MGGRLSFSPSLVKCSKHGHHAHFFNKSGSDWFVKWFCLPSPQSYFFIHSGIRVCKHFWFPALLPLCHLHPAPFFPRSSSLYTYPSSSKAIKPNLFFFFQTGAHCVAQASPTFLVWNNPSLLAAGIVCPPRT